MPYRNDEKECPVCGEIFVSDKLNICPTCLELMEFGILFVGVDSEKSNKENRPCRTGHVRLISEYSFEFIRVTGDFHPSLKEQIMKNRFCFMDEVFGKKLKIFDNPLLVN